ncbi:MAG: sulfatase [Spirochaetales bacterium]|nr:sulfatase [Spirochaetales bacterium]
MKVWNKMLVSGLALFTIGAKADAQEKQSNILFFLVDDMGWQDSSVEFFDQPTEFNKIYRTPNMQRLANNGVVFTNAHAAAISSPTRTSIMTGENPARHRVTNWTLEPGSDTSSYHPRLMSPAWNVNGLQPENALTLAQGLKMQGYKTIHVGKAHWGARGTRGESPLNLGFDVNIAGHAAGAPESYYAEANYGNFPDGSPNLPWGVPGLEKYYGSDVNLTDALTIEACREIEQAVSEGRNFYMYLAHYAVHTPLMKHPKYYDYYKSLGLDDIEATYASMVEAMDASLGAVLDKLEESGIADNTLIVFAADNGGLSISNRGRSPYGGFDTHNFPLREGKGSAYQGGTRIPMIVGAVSADNSLSIAAGTRNNSPVIIEDLFTSFLDFAGFAAWDKVPQIVDGRSFLPLLSHDSEIREAEEAERDVRPLLFHIPHQWTSYRGLKHSGYQPHSSLIVDGWKVIYFWDRSGRWELYNLREDISEKNNLARSNREKLQQMQQLLRDELASKKAQPPRRRLTKKNCIMK